jgi:hypothetical protein
MLSYHFGQKRKVTVTLEIECYDDVNVRDIDWADVLELEGAESVEVSVYEDNLCELF